MNGDKRWNPIKPMAIGLGVVTMLLLLTMPGLAGGWTTVTVDDVPITVRIDEPIQLGFMVRQHGNHPITLTEPPPALVARHVDSGKTLRLDARPQGETGHYIVEVAFPAAGEWTWRIHPAPFPAVDMAPITVEPAIVTSGQQTGWPWLASALAVLMGGASLVLWRGAARPRLALAVGGLSAVMAFSPVWQSAPGVTNIDVGPAPNAVATGRALFLAKGCATCHLHADIAASFNVQMGPELTHYTADSAYVQNWLRAPNQIKPDTNMPDLQLDEDEIGALTAFLLEAKKH